MALVGLNIVSILNVGGITYHMSCHTKSGAPILVPSSPNISKYLDPLIIYFNFNEIFRSPGTKISDIFGPL